MNSDHNSDIAEDIAQGDIEAGDIMTEVLNNSDTDSLVRLNNNTDNNSNINTSVVSDSDQVSIVPQCFDYIFVNIF